MAFEDDDDVKMTTAMLDRNTLQQDEGTQTEIELRDKNSLVHKKIY